jgi:beta-ribofuranosylaminobenzene 5'-phosphate synthase
MQLEITTFCRIHITLLDLSSEGYRRNGGIGFATGHPAARIYADSASRCNVRFLTEDEPGLASALVQKLESLRGANSLKKGCEIQIERLVPAHVGLGSGSGIALSCIEALFLINKRTIPPEHIIRASGRGGGSGIGVSTYFFGGLVFDGGRKNCGEPFAPSSGHLAYEFVPPTLVSRYEGKRHSVALCIPKLLRGLSGPQEENFFKEVCPIPLVDVHQVVYQTCMGFLPAFLEDDTAALARAVDEIQNCSWKRLERERHGDALPKMERFLRKRGISGVGMSSMGPVLYYFGHDMAPVTELFPSDWVLVKTFVRDSGREIRL